MNNIRSFSVWRLMLMSLLAFLVVACKPYATFTVSPDPVVAGQAATFDASASAVWTSPRNNAVVSYAWKFGDGGTASGKIATHTYATAGTYTVELTVTDKAGRVGTTKDRVTVRAGSGVSGVPLKVVVRSAGGTDLSGATVTLGTTSATSGNDGVASLTAPAGANQIVTVKKVGYVTQVLRQTLVAGSTGTELLALLTPVKETFSIANIAEAQQIGSSVLGAFVRLPANALVNASTGADATGAATLQLTPWDITSGELRAIPGNGRATDGTTEFDLISAGMMTVDFFDANGNKLQLAAGKSAVIQMDLPFNSIGGNALVVGSQIPIWNFDEAAGLWKQEGTGTVVAGGGPFGLAVQATVSHFSTWNWDFKFDNPGSVTISCVDETNALVACNVTAEVTLTDGSRFTRSGFIGATPTQIINMPNGGTISWTAVTAGGLIGVATSGTSGTVQIPIAAPATNNAVRCVLPGNVGVACDVTLTVPTANGPKIVKTRVPAEGATIKTAFVPNANLSWVAQSLPSTNASGVLVITSGSASSAATGAVNIAMGNEVPVPSKRVRLACSGTAVVFGGRIIDAARVAPGQSVEVPLTSCSISANFFAFTQQEEDLGRSYQFDNVPVGTVVLLTLPDIDGSSLEVSAQGLVTVPDEPLPVSVFGTFFSDVASLVDNALQTLNLTGNTGIIEVPSLN